MTDLYRRPPSIQQAVERRIDKFNKSKAVSETVHGDVVKTSELHFQWLNFQLYVM